MHIISDDDPLVRPRRPYNSVTGSELTLGAVKKLADAADENRTALAKLTADLDAKIAGLNKRFDEYCETVETVKAENAKRAASRANIIAWIRAQPNPASFETLARNNGISMSEVLP